MSDAGRVAMNEQGHAGGDDYDPFEAFDDVIGGDLRDPYPDFAEKRAKTPVWKGNLVGHLMPEAMTASDSYTAFRFEDCSRILRSARIFSSTGYDTSIGLVMGHMILGMDDPEHRLHRNLVANAFKEKSLARWEAELIGPLCHELIDRFAHSGKAELVRQLTFEFPVRVIARLLGLPEEDFAQFQRWSIELIGLGADIDRGLAASDSLKSYFSAVVADRRRSPRQDVISDLVRADIDGDKLTDEAINAFLLLLLPAGAETTYRSSGNLLFLLLTHPDQLAAVLGDRTLVDQAIEEALRLEPPLLMINRTTTEDVELGGVTIGAGVDVSTCLGSANHDETRWENPDAFDIFRPPQQHVAFAFGPHMCLGMHLARLETRVVLNAVLDRLPGIRLDPEGDDPHIRGLIFRSPTSVPVLFDA
jgi:cytochrome P450